MGEQLNSALGRRAVAEAEVTAGAFAFRAFVHADGEVVLPENLRDPGVRREIGAAARAAALAELRRRWTAVDVKEARHERAAAVRS